MPSQDIYWLGLAIKDADEPPSHRNIMCPTNAVDKIHGVMWCGVNLYCALSLSLCII